MFAHSIRWRLQAWLAFLLICVLSGFVIAVFQLQRLNHFNQVDEQLERRTTALGRLVRGGPPPGFGPGRPPFDARRNGPGGNDVVRRPPSLDPRPTGPPGHEPELEPRTREIRLTPEVAALFDESQTNGFYFSIWARDGGLLKRSTNAPDILPLPMRLRADTRTHTRTRDPFREAYYFTELGDCVLAGRDITTDLAAMKRFTWWLLAAGGSVLALGLGGGWWLTARALRPVEDISAAATRISGGNLAERIPVANRDDELGRLTAVLNSTFARLEAAFARQKQFTADASHELRTPLSVLISEAQTTLARERSSAEYREAVETCLGTAQQMRRLTDSLLQLARLDADSEPMRHETLDLSEVAQRCVAQLAPIAAKRGIRFICTLMPSPVSGDADQLAQVATNLLTNAFEYSRNEGEIHVRCRLEAGQARLSIQDFGNGIAADGLPHIFERFYRADKSRGRSEGHAGLGLAITKAIVDAHHGNLEVTSHPGIGSEFIVRIPSLPSPDPAPDSPG